MHTSTHSHKPILIITPDDGEIVQIEKDIEDGNKSLEETRKFLSKQMDEAWDKCVGVHFARLAGMLGARGLLPKDYLDDKYSLCIHDGVIYISDNDSQPSVSGLKSLLLSLLSKDHE